MTDAILAKEIRQLRSEIATLATEIRNLRVAVERNEVMNQETMNRILAAVEKDEELDSAAITLMNSLSEQLRGLATQPVSDDTLKQQLLSMADRLEANNQRTAEALSANTPAARV